MAVLDHPDTQGHSRPARRVDAIGRLFARSSLIWIWILLVIIFGALRPHTFLTTQTLTTVLGDQAITAVMALALVMPIAANTFDLAIGGTMGLAIVLSSQLMVQNHFPIVLAILVVLVIGAVVGLANSYIVVRLNVSSFITTLGMSTILIALQEWISGGTQVSYGIPEKFLALGQTTVLSIPMIVVYMLIIAGILWYVLDHRQFGRFVYATGANAEAARLAGVRTRRITTVALVVSGVVASIAGLLFVMRIGGGALDAGSSYLLPAFAAVFLGATQFKQGKVNVPGTLVAVYVLATGVKGVQLLGSPFWVQDLFNGVALIIAVALAVRSGQHRQL